VKALNPRGTQARINLAVVLEEVLAAALLLFPEGLHRTPEAYFLSQCRLRITVFHLVLFHPLYTILVPQEVILLMNTVSLAMDKYLALSPCTLHHIRWAIFQTKVLVELVDQVVASFHQAPKDFRRKHLEHFHLYHRWTRQGITLRRLSMVMGLVDRAIRVEAIKILTLLLLAWAQVVLFSHHTPLVCLATAIMECILAACPVIHMVSRHILRSTHSRGQGVVASAHHHQEDGMVVDNEEQGKLLPTQVFQGLLSSSLGVQRAQMVQISSFFTSPMIFRIRRCMTCSQSLAMF
jgi:hypothetical protein